MVSTTDPDTECWRKHALASLTALQSEAANPKIEASARDELDALLLRAGLIISTATAPQNEPRSNTEDWAWSTDTEFFRYASVDELIENEDGLMPGRVVYRGRSLRISPNQLIDAVDVLDTMGDRARDLAGEAAEGYPHPLRAEAKETLDKLLAHWINANMPITFWQVTDVEEYTLTVDDFDETDPRLMGVES